MRGHNPERKAPSKQKSTDQSTSPLSSSARVLAHPEFKGQAGSIPDESKKFDATQAWIPANLKLVLGRLKVKSSQLTEAKTPERLKSPGVDTTQQNLLSVYNGFKTIIEMHENLIKTHSDHPKLSKEILEKFIQDAADEKDLGIRLSEAGSLYGFKFLAEHGQDQKGHEKSNQIAPELLKLDEKLTYPQVLEKLIDIYAKTTDEIRKETSHMANAILGLTSAAIKKCNSFASHPSNVDAQKNWLIDCIKKMNEIDTAYFSVRPSLNVVQHFGQHCSMQNLVNALELEFKQHAQKWDAKGGFDAYIAALNKEPKEHAYTCMLGMLLKQLKSNPDIEVKLVVDKLSSDIPEDFKKLLNAVELPEPNPNLPQARL